MPNTHYRTCNLCEAMCGLEIVHEGNEVISVKGDKQDPFSEGHICPKALALKDIYEDPNRLKTPLKRTVDGWQEISWKQAIKEVAEGLAAVSEKYGNDAVGVYSGNPNVHNVGALLTSPGFFKTLKTKNRFSATSVDQLPHQFMAYLMYGHQIQIPIPDIDRTDMLIILGANPLVSNGSLLTAPNIKKRLKGIQDRGGKVINIDPRFTETSEKSDQHLFIHPGTDLFLLLGMMQILVKEELTDLGRFQGHVNGLEEILALASEYSLEQVCAITGISEEGITTLTHEFAKAKKAVIYGRMGACTQEFGGLTMWMVNVLNIITANFDEPGGYMFTTPAIDLKPQISKGHINKWQSRVRGLPEVGSELPCAVMAEEILTEGEGQIKAMIINAGNPVLSTPNGIQLEKAFESLEFMVSIDIYLNETSKLANIILPTATGLETSHYDLVFHSLAVRNTSKYSPPLFAPAKGAKYDWEVFRLLKMAYLKATGKLGFKQRMRLWLENQISIEKILAIGLRHGPHKSAVSFKKLKQNPHGIDLGALQSQMPEALYQKDKKINLFPSELKDDLQQAIVRLNEFKADPSGLLLIGRRQLRTCNSWLHNSPRLIKNNPCDLYIHPEDADRCGIKENQEVKVTSKVGSVTVPFVITDKIMPGTVSLPHGWGHHGEVRLDVAITSPGASINDLTDDQFIDQLTGNAALSGVKVAVEAG